MPALCNAAKNPPWTYSLKLYVPDDVSEPQRQNAHRLFREALEMALGGAAMVWPMYEIHRAIVQQYGEAPEDDDLNAQQRLVFDSLAAG